MKRFQEVNTWGADGATRAGSAGCMLKRDYRIVPYNRPPLSKRPSPFRLSLCLCLCLSVRPSICTIIWSSQDIKKTTWCRQRKGLLGCWSSCFSSIMKQVSMKTRSNCETPSVFMSLTGELFLFFFASFVLFVLFPLFSLYCRISLLQASWKLPRRVHRYS